MHSQFFHFELDFMQFSKQPFAAFLNGDFLLILQYRSARFCLLFFLNESVPSEPLCKGETIQGRKLFAEKLWVPTRIADWFDFKSLIFFTDLEDLLGFLDVKKQETRLNCASKHGVSS